MSPHTRTPPGEGGAGETRTVSETVPIVPQSAPQGNTFAFLRALYSDLLNPSRQQHDHHAERCALGVPSGTGGTP